MANPAMVFGNPRPSGRRLARGDIINMEIAAGYRGYTAQIGSPICLGPPTDMVRRFWDEITLPAFRNMAAEIRPGNPVEAIRAAGEFFRQKGVQSRPIHAHGIDLVTDGPHVFTDGVHGEAFEQVFRPGMVFMAEPNPITADGNFGIFLGHTFIVTETGHECVDAFPWELVVV
jgi:Xaa-Pro dipeptidase